MTHIFNDPAGFKPDVVRGFAAAYPQFVDRVAGASGFIRAGGPLDGKVSLVVGGGSGHYPSYSGVVGAGFADGAVLGDVFASPSAEQVYRVSRAADGGAGLVLAFGNYAGDRLNFGVAADRLRTEGIDVRIVYVTDDIASAPLGERDKRRGIAGTFAVYKIGGAAADEGFDLDGVEQVMLQANAATFSFGVAFGGCTLPGADTSLFTVKPGQMDFGLGIHGEPGISTQAWMPANDLAVKLADTVLAERPGPADGRAAVLLNGLGATKYEELFILFGSLVEHLSQRGVELVMPEVGELVTSLDMAGCSLTVTWLDDNLERLWTAPAATPAFRRGALRASTKFTARRPLVSVQPEVTVEEASDTSLAAAIVARRAMEVLNRVVEKNKDMLGQLDSVAGDGDHGTGMSRGSTAAMRAAQQTQGGVQTVLGAAAAAFGDSAGGTSGILWGMLIDGVGKSLGNIEAVNAERVSAAVRRSATDLRTFSGAQLGDKTMLDALFPFVNILSAQVDAGTSLGLAWARAAEEAVAASEATASLVPKIGRARPLAERSVGTPDPGAISLGLIVSALGAVIAEADCTA